MSSPATVPLPARAADEGGAASVGSPAAVSDEASDIPRPERPDFSPGYGLGGKDHDTASLPWPAVLDRLRNSRNYWITTVRDDGRPHAMPVWGVLLDHTVLFSTDAASVKGRNLQARPDCVLHLESGDDVVIVEGRASRVTDPALLPRFVEAYLEKYEITVDVANPAFSVFAVSPRSVLGWLEADFVATATRWRVAS